MSVPTFSTIENHEKLDELEPQWINMLGHQLPSLPPIDSFWIELPAFFMWLVSGEPKVTLEPLKLATGDQIYRPGRMRNVFEFNPHLETIQYAAANRLCVNLGYSNKQRIVEPLSFRQSKDGKKFFFGYERDASTVKMYELRKIQSVSLTNFPYSPKYPVEISASGPINMPRIRRT
jgi:hypothetical protein